MFDSRDKQLADLQTAYASFMDTLTDLASENILTSLGNWTPRDIAAHFIGWNRITLAAAHFAKVPSHFIFTMARMIIARSTRSFLFNFPPQIKAN